MFSGGKPHGWRARTRTWNMGAKNPCDTFSPLAIMDATRPCCVGHES